MTPQIPHSAEAEEAVLGALFINTELFQEVSAIIQPGDFYVHRNGWVFDAFASLVKKSEPIDVLTVAEELDRNGKLAEAGGPAYLTTLINSAPFSGNAASYARTVAQHSTRRAMIQVANVIAQSAYNEELDVEKGLDAAHKAVVNLLKRGDENEGKDEQLKDLLVPVYQQVLDRHANPKDVWGIPTGFPKLDIYTGGQHISELTVLAGEPGMGKTWYSITAALEMAKHSPGAFRSMEMKKDAIARRALAGMSHVPVRRLQTGHWADGDNEKINFGLRSIEDSPIFISDKKTDIYGFWKYLSGLKRRHKIEWFILDYLMLVDEKAKDETEMTAKVSAGLKNICMDLDLAGIVLHSVNKQGMDREGAEGAAKSYLRGSGQVIHDADVIFFLSPFKGEDDLQWIREPDQKKMATLWVKKGRELEESNKHMHMVRRGDSPLFAELDTFHTIADHQIRYEGEQK